MKGAVFCVAMVLLFSLSNNVAEAQGLTSALRTRVSKVKDVIKPAADKFLPRLRTGAVGALLVAMIYTGGMLPTDVVAHDAIRLSAHDETVVISQNADERLVMPVHWLTEKTSEELSPFIVSPDLVRNLARTLTKFVADNDSGELLAVSRMLRHWEEQLGERGVDVRIVVEAMQQARERGRGITGVRLDGYKGYLIEALRQQLASLTPAELMAGLNAAFVRDKDSLDSNSGGGVDSFTGLHVLRRYLESGYVRLEVEDDKVHSKIASSQLYNFTSEGELVARARHESRFFDRKNTNEVSHLAIIKDHNGIVNGLLTNGYVSDEYDLRQHLEIATELRRGKIVKAMLAKIKKDRNPFLSGAAGRGDLQEVVKQLESGADDINTALSEAAARGEIEMVDFLLDYIDGDVDINALFIDSIWGANQEMVDHLVDLGADDFAGALSEVIGYEAETSYEFVRRLIYQVIAKKIPSELNSALGTVLSAYDVVGNGIEVAEDLVRDLIRAGADDLEGALEVVAEDEAKYLRKIFAEERAKQNPTQLPQQH